MGNMAKIVAVCTSDQKGVSKSPVVQASLRADYGLEGDAHAGPEDCKRQVSLLAIESIGKMNSQGFDFKPGDFAENLTTSGIALATLPIGTVLNVGKDVVLEVTQIGKKCHTGCAIFKQAGTCIMPKEGIFARVLKGGRVQPGDEVLMQG
jgi:MOSC domain-containing protein YiiM